MAQDDMKTNLNDLEHVLLLVTVLWVPRPLRKRIGALLLSLVAAANRAQEKWAEGSRDEEAVCRSVILLRLGPALLLRTPNRDRDGNMKAAAELRQRAATAETGQWKQLLQELHEAVQRPKRRSQEEREESTSAEAAELKTYQAVAGKLKGKCMRAACQHLLGNAKAEPTQDTATQVFKLAALGLGDDEPEKQTAAKVAAVRAETTRSWLLLCTARLRLANLKPAAEPGPSGWRNAHLQLVGAMPYGSMELVRWAQRLADAAWPVGAMAGLTAVHVIQLFKKAEQGARGGIRAIVLSEVLVKFAERLITEEQGKYLESAAGMYQFGVCTPGGAEVLLETMRELVRQPQTQVVLCLDVSKAFGSAYRGKALQAVEERMLYLIGVLAQQWAEPQGSWAWLRVEDGWASIRVRRGLWQGSAASTPAFAALQDVCVARADRWAEECDATPPKRFSFVDDGFLAGRAQDVVPHYTRVRTAYDEAGLALAEHKLQRWAQRLADDEGPDELGPAAASLAGVGTRHIGGLPMLGAGLADKVDGDLGMWATAAEAQRKQMQWAALLSCALCRYALSDVVPEIVQGAWDTTTKVLARALDYDARTTEWDAMVAAAGMLDEIVTDVLAVLLARRPSRIEMEQLDFPGSLAGCSLRCVDAAHVAAARLASLWAAAQHVHSRLGSWGYAAAGHRAEDEQELECVLRAHGLRATPGS